MQMKIAAQLSGAEQVPPVQTAGTGKFQGTVAGSKFDLVPAEFLRPEYSCHGGAHPFREESHKRRARRLLLRGWREAAVSAVRGHRHGKDYRGKRHRYRRYETG